MPTVAEQNILSPILAGRVDELAALRRWIEGARDGAGVTILISGEAGIGKSRLLRECIQMSDSFEKSDILVLQGNCYEQDHALPFAPFVDLLHRADARLLREAWHLDQLLKLAPDLAARFPDVELAPIAEPEQEKRDLIRAWVSFIVKKRHGAPLLIVIEDLHWCDDVSLELLVHLARAIVSRPIALLLTYRSDETTHSLQRFLAQLDRERLAHEIALMSLQSHDVEAMMRGIFQQTNPISRDFLEAICARTEGNPFFVEEVLRTMVASGDIFHLNGRWTRKQTSELRVPRTVQVAVTQRAERLSDNARQSLQAASVIGQRFDAALLQKLTMANEMELVTNLRELMDAQLVVEGSADEFAFRHALTREAAYSSLLKRERRELHLAVGEVLEAECAQTLIERDAELSYHFYHAAAWEKALTYACRAGKKAEAVFAPREAIAHFTRAIEAAETLKAARSEGTFKVFDLHRARGKAYEQVGEFDNAREDFDVALAAAQSSGDLQVEWQTLLDLGFLWASRDYVTAGALFQGALEIAPRLDNPRSAASTMNRVGNWHMNAERPFEAIRYHNEALRLFESLGDKQGIASTLDLLGISHYVAGEYHRSIEFYSRAVALFRELHDHAGLLTALSIGSSRGIAWLGRTVLPTQSRLQDRIRDCDETLRMAISMGARPIETLAQTWLGLNYAMSGEYGPALDHARRGLAIAEEIEHRHFMCTANMVLGILHWDMAAWAPARAHLELGLALARETNSTIWQHFCAAFLTLALIALDDLRTADATLRGEWSDETPMNGVGFRQLWAARAELLIAQGEPKRALDVIERLINTVPNFGMHRSDKIPYLVWLRGEALIALGRAHEAAKAIEAGLSGARECDLPALEWRLGVSLGKALLAEGKRDDAATAFANARRLAETLAGNLDDDALRGGLLKTATVSMSRVVLDSPRRKAKAQYDGLTRREREVAGHVAHGRSNREIAEAMVVSERTVETHVANILSKLGFASRAQIAVWASDKFLS
ncbi:MAG: hypothetical protein KatS3mg053_2911 [Candidatus Roseilinea sp.]|nr:MAG: hypothetical protein KatS3mg053_2911 [Candidatus Roseilinea sp.]